MADERIRFRCYRCGKLLGASTRRAGSVVTCPQCRAEIQVPEASASEAEPEVQQIAPITIMPPEEVAVEPEIAAIVGALNPSPAPVPPIRIEPESIRPADAPAPRSPDVVLPPAVVLAWSLLVLSAIPMAFLAGLLIGHFLWK